MSEEYSRIPALEDAQQDCFLLTVTQETRLAHLRMKLFDLLISAYLVFGFTMS